MKDEKKKGLGAEEILEEPRIKMAEGALERKKEGFAVENGRLADRLEDACLRFDVLPEDCLDWAIKKDCVILVLPNGQKKVVEI